MRLRSRGNCLTIPRIDYLEPFWEHCESTDSKEHGIDQLRSTL
jgi:hypothetical protein